MSTTHSVIIGDTYDSLARRYYGSEARASAIRSANPGAGDPPIAGALLLIPDDPTAPVNRQQAAAAADPDEVAVLIDGQRFRFWTQVRVTRALDAPDTVELQAPFDPSDPVLRRAFRPFAYPLLVVTVGGAPIFTGTLVSVVPNLGNSEVTLSAGAYSLPGVLGDCTPPASAFPLEYSGATLRDIATALCEPFGLTVEFADDAGAAFESAAIEPGGMVLDFLTKLAKQRGLLISTTERGALLFRKAPATGVPVAVLRQGSAPLLSVQPFLNAQQYYSHITGLESVFVGSAGSQFTVRNPHAAKARPFTFSAPDTEGGDIETATRAKAGRMLANAVRYSVGVATWRTARGALWQPGDTISLEAAGAMVFAPYSFTVRSIAFSADSQGGRTADLDLVLPGVFNGTIPEALPWGE